MIWQAWLAVTGIMALSAHYAFIRKQAAVHSALATGITGGVAAFGALSIQVPMHSDTPETLVYSHPSVAVVCALTSLLGFVVFAAALTGRYGSEQNSDMQDATGDLDQQSWSD